MGLEALKTVLTWLELKQDELATPYLCKLLYAHLGLLLYPRLFEETANAFVLVILI